MDVSEDPGLEDMDADGDGKVTQAEEDAWYAAEEAASMKEGDANGDGVATSEELDAWIDRESEECPQVEQEVTASDGSTLTGVDFNCDGKISPAQEEAWYEGEGAPAVDFPLSLDKDPWLSDADTDDNGNVTEAEFDAWAG
jgi:hypothetical protein